MHNFDIFLTKVLILGQFQSKLRKFCQNIPKFEILKNFVFSKKRDFTAFAVESYNI
jgi:hypothetical protein